MRGFLLVACVILHTAAPLGTAAGEPSPESVAEFTRRVQPILLNRCGAGACHGGSGAGNLTLVRRDLTGKITREITLANMEAILDACQPERTSAGLIATISRRHPESATKARELATPLTASERATLERWIDSSLAGATFGRPASMPQRAPNRFQKLLDEAANPPPLPPPQEPKGLRIE